MSDKSVNTQKDNQQKIKKQKNKSLNMKKVVFSIIGLYIFIYILLFSQLGNALVKRNIEFLLNTDSQYNIKLTTFNLDTKRFYMVGDVDRGAMIFTIDYVYKEGEGKYSLDIKDISKLDGLDLDKNIKGRFKTKGVIRKLADQKISLDGNINDYDNISYNMIATLDEADFWTFDFNVGVKKIDFKLNPISLKQIMKLTKDKAPIDAQVLISGNVIDPISKNAVQKINIKLLNGTIDTKSLDLGDLDTSSVPKNFTFNSDITANIVNNQATIDGEFLSTMVNMYTKGAKVDMVDDTFDANYKVVFNLDKLKLENGKHLKGKISTVGTIKGSSDNYTVNGRSGLYGSKTTYSFDVINDITKNLKVHIKNASLKEMARVAGETIDADGKINTVINIKNTQPGNLDGIIISTLNNVVMNKEEVKRKFDVEVPDDMKLEVRSETTLKGDKAFFKSIMNIGAARFKMYNAQMDLDTNEFHGKYKLILGDFSKIKLQNGLENDLPLEILNNTQPIVVNGNIQTQGDDLEVTGRAKVLDGKFRFRFFEDVLNVRFDQVANTDVNLNINYDNINRKTIANLYVANNDSTLTINNAKYNAYDQTINSKIELESFGKRVVYNITGNIHNPSIVVRTYSALISKEFEKEMRKKIANIIDNKQARAKLDRLIHFMAQKNATFTNKDFAQTSDALNIFIQKIKADVEKTSKYEGDGLDEKSIEELRRVVLTLNNKHRFLSKEDVRDLKGVIAEISEDFQTQWKSPYYQKEKRNALRTLQKISLNLKAGNTIDDDEIQMYIEELNNVTDEFQMYLSDREKINQVLSKFKSIERFGALLGTDIAINDKHILKTVDELNILIDYFQRELSKESTIKKAKAMAKRLGQELHHQVKKELKKVKN